MESWIAPPLLGEEVQKVPLRHKGHEAAPRWQVRHFAHEDVVAADTHADLTDLLVRTLEKLFEDAQFAHHFEGRGMEVVAAEVAEKVGVLLQDQNLHSRPRQQVTQHHPGWTAACDTASHRQSSEHRSTRYNVFR